MSIPESPKLLEQVELNEHFRLLDFANTLKQRSANFNVSIDLDETGKIAVDEAICFAFNNAEFCEDAGEVKDLLDFVEYFSGFSLPFEVTVTADRLVYAEVPIHPYNHVAAKNLGDSLIDSIMVCIMTGDQKLTTNQEAIALEEYEKIRGIASGRRLYRMIRNQLFVADLGIALAATVKGIAEDEWHPYKKFYRKRRDPLIQAHYKNKRFGNRHINTAAYRIKVVKADLGIASGGNI